MSANTPDLEKSYAKYWEGVRLLESKLGLHPSTMFHDFMAGLETADQAGTMIYLARNEKSQGQDPSKLDIPPSFKKGDLNIKSGEIPRISGNPIEYLGTAVFKRDKLVNTLNYTETQALLILKGIYKTGIITMQDPIDKKGYIPLEVKQGAPPRISVDTSGDTVQISETISLEGDLMAVQSTVDYATNFANLQKLESVFEQRLQENSLAMLTNLQKNGTDIIGYGEYAQKNFLTRQQWNDFDWSGRFKNAEFDLKVKFKLRRTGLLGKQPVIR
jgi:hypothetical protein